MTNGDLKKIISQIDEPALRESATFGIDQWGQGADESFIKANKEGLLLFAIQLLQAAAAADEVVGNKERSIVPLDIENNWMDQEAPTVIHYVEAVNKRDERSSQVNRRRTVADLLIPVGCGLVALVVLGSFLLGLYTMLSFFFW